MEDAKDKKTPMDTKCHLQFKPKGIVVDQKLYGSMIGSLLYLCAFRPDIVLTVGVCGRYQAAPKESHMLVVKRILRYLIHTPRFGLWYPRIHPLLFRVSRI